MKFANIEIETLDYRVVYVPMDEPIPNFAYPPGVTDYGLYHLVEKEFYTTEKRVFNALQGIMIVGCLCLPIRKKVGMITLFKKI